ncbi:MAG TPA: carboxypeptidase regulatory-like domain-containing protein [Gemmatimonadaceae bacterium]|nr:carboxypeptidase regulatory-like domain-containing protein [Gemmatimonadaceae bacterium]
MLLLPAFASVSAQSVGAISGTIRDSTGTPIPGVEVVLRQIKGAVRSDSLGVFRFADVPAGHRQLHFRRLGFAPKSIDADIADGKTLALTVVLDAAATEIEGMTVEEVTRRRQFLADFYDRSSRGFGHFVTREQIEKRNPMNLSDMMRTIPGARLIPMRNGGQAALRFNRAMGGRDCPPQYWVDGVKTYALNIDDIIPQDVEGIEIYEGASSIPPQFNTKEGTTICGVVLIWTRIPGT